MQHFMDGILPLEPLPGVDFVDPEYPSLRSVGIKVPGIAVFGLVGAGLPGGFQLFPPAWFKPFVQIHTDADLRILGHQFQRAVAGSIEPPGGDFLLIHLGAPGPQFFHSVVGGTGVQNDDGVGLLHGIHPGVGELFLIFADGVDTNPVVIHGRPPSGCTKHKKKGDRPHRDDPPAD